MIRLATFNLRCPAASDGENYFPYRLPGILDTLSINKPGIVGFQEMTDASFEAMASMLSDYEFFGHGRNADLTGESCRVAYRKDGFTLCAGDTFWLSPSPRVPASRFEHQSHCPRVCTWVKLFDKESGQFFYFINTHLDHEEEEARVKGLKILLDTAKKLKQAHDIPLFVTGDFNCQPTESTYSLIAKYGLHDLTDGIKSTFHGYGRCENNKIDYILTDQPRERFTVSTWHESPLGKYLSDHDAVVADWQNA